MPIDRTLPHTIWWWIADPKDPMPAPYQAFCDNADEAEAMAKNFVDNRNDPYERLRWIKVFRSGNENYETFRWENPNPVIDHEEFKFEEEQELPKKRRFRLFSRWGK